LITIARPRIQVRTRAAIIERVLAYAGYTADSDYQAIED